MPSKTLSTYVKSFQFFPKSSIYDDDSKYRISDFNRHEATLYFIVRTNKASFRSREFALGQGCVFRGPIDIGANRLSVEIDCIDLLLQHPKLKAQFDTRVEFLDHYMRMFHDKDRPHLTSEQKYMELAFVDHAKSSADRLVVQCPVKKAVTRGGDGDVVLSPYQVINHLALPYPTPLEILYIGKSTDDTWDRIYNHNKWGLIEENRDENQELLVYFLEIEKSAITDEETHGQRVISRHESELSIEDATVATEAALINYFIKHKKFNDHHVGSDITKSEAVRRVKLSGYTDMMVECKLDGAFSAVGTPSSGFHANHSVQYNL